MIRSVWLRGRRTEGRLLHHKHMSRSAAGAIRMVVTCLLAIVMVACGGTGTSSPGSPKPPGFAALTGKRVAGTPSDWIPIGSPFNQPKNVSTTVIPPVQTNGTGANGDQTVAFFDFRNSTDAAAFTATPPLDARLIASGIQAFDSLQGSTGVPGTSRGLDLRECLWAGGPGQGGAAGRGTPSGGNLLANGQCSQGTSSSIGVGTIIQRGAIVVLVETIDTTVVGGPADPSELSQNTALASAALQLLGSVGL